MKLLAYLCVAASLCASCATGIAPLSDEEAIACRNEGCAAFTEAEILGILGRAYKDGYIKGWTDFGRQSGRAL